MYMFSKSTDTGYGPVTLNNKGLKWQSKVSHQGNILNQRLDDDDLRKKKGHSIVLTKCLLTFQMCSQLY